MCITLVISRDPRAPDSAVAEDLAACACAAGWKVRLVPPLYHLPANSPLWTDLAAVPGPLAVGAQLHPRPAYWLLRRQGLTAAPLVTFDLRRIAHPAALLPRLAARLGVAPPPDGGPPGEIRRLEADGAARWYPVVDRSLCTSCGHCQQFCLFGVYDRDAQGRVTVTHPDQCKAGCPACSRLCPPGALMFPLHEQEPALAGAPGAVRGPDSAAQRLYYARTGAVCPRCERGAEQRRAQADYAGEACPECGYPLPAQPLPAAAEPDELDRLVELLERRAQEGR